VWKWFNVFILASFLAMACLPHQLVYAQSWIDNSTIFINGTCEYRFVYGLNITDNILTVNDSGIYKNITRLYDWGCEDSYVSSFIYFIIFMAFVLFVSLRRPRKVAAG
jgi:hypothetical protein